MLLQDFFDSARLHRMHKKKFLPKSAVYYLYHLKSNNIIVQWENHQYKKLLLYVIDFVELKTLLCIANSCK